MYIWFKLKMPAILLNIEHRRRVQTRDTRFGIWWNLIIQIFRYPKRIRFSFVPSCLFGVFSISILNIHTTGFINSRAFFLLRIMLISNRLLLLFKRKARYFSPFFSPVLLFIPTELCPVNIKALFFYAAVKSILQGPKELSWPVLESYKSLH